MRLHVLSDLHLESGDYAPASVDCNAVVLVGNIHSRVQAIPWIRQNYPDRPVIYVTGNHEYYRTALPKLDDMIRKAAEGSAIQPLENRAAVVGGVRFLGCVLWTDFALFGDGERGRCMAAAERIVNDYQLIRLSPRYSRLTPRDTARLHLQSRRWLQGELAKPFPGRTAVVTHHAPSLLSLREHHREDPVSAAFAENMETFLLVHPADLWIHGHTHHCADYRIGNTRVVSNQRGYAGEEVPGFQPDLVVEV